MQLTRLRLSVVIPAYNEETHLGECLAAIGRQTSMPDEVIVVDNNSTDKTAHIASQFPFVTLIHEKRQGLRFARNTGMDAASGDIIGRIDADTVMAPEWCAQARQLFAHPNVYAATGSCYYYDFPGHAASLRIDRLFRRLAFSMGKPILYGSNMVLKRAAWQHIRPLVCMKGSFFEDCDITIHLNESGYAATFDTKLVVGVSARRLDDSPIEFYSNMQQFDQTYAAHGIRNPSARCAKYIFLMSYPSLKLMRRAYNPETKTFSIGRFIRVRAESRPTSNT